MISERIACGWGAYDGACGHDPPAAWSGGRRRPFERLDDVVPGVVNAASLMCALYEAMI